MECLEEELTRIKESLEAAEGERVRLKEELEQKTERADRIISRGDEERARLKKEIKGLEDDKEDLKAEILEWEQTRIELDAIAEQLKDWEKVKARYEEHIKMLTLRLRDARGRKGNFGVSSDPASSGADSLIESDILDESDGSPFIAKPAPIDMLAGALTEGLTRSTSHPHSKGEKGRNKENKDSSFQRRTPRRRRLPKDDSDWLMTLPTE